MTTAPRHQPRIIQVLFAGIASIAMLAFVDAAQPAAAAAMFGQIRLTAIETPAPQAPPNVVGGGLAADDNDDQARLQQQLAEQQLQQSEQQAEQQNEAAQQQAQQAEQQGQWVEQNPGP
ncbi:hypothetical protein [Mycobacterium montefiorense]|uniref:hypothetical protein n=1 Tax=Mycobacterium montefiorense TaxID=154654 RepID=UPI0021DC7136|nr:hypothetical protein [Mycobacterium montefiorense]MCV7425686.1 hypothetical protein [Mycobacterium montefiorense]GLE52059.1 hypothetical protein ATCCBAA256_16340 [Mycobacterium montefiorense]